MKDNKAEEVLVANRYLRPLVRSSLGGKIESNYVLVSHHELDNLVGRLMQMCDLIGDIEQRTALKGTIKQINRDWLDDLYEQSGYDRWTGPVKGARIIKD